MGFVNRLTVRPVCEKLFAETFGVQEDEWSQIYLMPFKCTIEVKMRVFQFKLSHNILFTNDRLYKMKVTDSLTCNFCQAEIETHVHLFYECNFTSKLRQELVERISTQFCVEFGDFTRKRVMLGFIKDWKGPNRTLLNHLVLLYI